MRDKYVPMGGILMSNGIPILYANHIPVHPWQSLTKSLYVIHDIMSAWRYGYYLGREDIHGEAVKIVGILGPRWLGCLPKREPFVVTSLGK